MKHTKAAAITLSLLAPMAQAGVGDEDYMTVSAVVTPNCTDITVPVLDLGSVLQGTEVAIPGVISVVCGQGTDYIVAIERGDNFDSSAGTRRLGLNGLYLPYTLLAGDCSSTTEVGTDFAAGGPSYAPDAEYAAPALTGTGSGAAQNIGICAKVTPEASFVAAPSDGANYTDLVRVVVAF